MMTENESEKEDFLRLTEYINILIGFYEDLNIFEKCNRFLSNPTFYNSHLIVRGIISLASRVTRVIINKK